MIKKNAKHFAKGINQNDMKKIVKAKPEEPNIIKTSEKVLHCAALVLLSCLVYANSLHGDFVHDDIPAIVTNEDALGQSSLCSVFCNDFWGMSIRDRRSHKSYRPVTILTFR